jgi:hypothetical protein
VIDAPAERQLEGAQGPGDRHAGSAREPVLEELLDREADVGPEGDGVVAVLGLMAEAAELIGARAIAAWMSGPRPSGQRASRAGSSMVCI